MSTTYTLRTSELDEKFLERVRTFFGETTLNITIEEAVDDSEDEGEFRMTPETERELLERIDDVRNNRNIIVPDQKQFQ